MQLIESNPFRILSVYANARPADIVANCDDMEAYLSIEQIVHFDLDFDNLMPAVRRTIEIVNQAKGEINLPICKLKYALFWFIKDNSSAHAMNYLKNSDLENAINTFKIEDSFSTRINIAVVAMIQNNLGTAIANITKMIHDDNMREEFVNTICGNAFTISEDDLAHLYIDALLEEVSTTDLLDLFIENGISREDDDYLKGKAVDEPISRINTEIAKAKIVKRDDAVANYRVGKALMQDTKSDLKKVKDLLGSSDMKYQLLADDLAETILQCGINYYNNTDDDDNIEKALKLQDYARKIAVGNICKDRCKANVRILKQKQEEAAPVLVRKEDSAIKQEILLFSQKTQKISHSIELIKTCAPYLVTIKEAIGIDAPYYLKISTLVVNIALRCVINAVNEMQDANPSLDLLRSTLKDAWKATLYMSKLDMESDFKRERYNPNRNTLKSIVDRLYISTNDLNADDLDMRTEKEICDSCSTIAQCDYYLRRYPSGKYKSKIILKRAVLQEKEEEERAKRQKELEAKRKKEEELRRKDDAAYNQCHSISDYKKYLANFPHGRHNYDAKRKIEELEEQNRKIGCWIAIVLFVIGGIVGAVIGESATAGFFTGLIITAAWLLFVNLKWNS